MHERRGWGADGGKGSEVRGNVGKGEVKMAERTELLEKIRGTDRDEGGLEG